MPNFWLQINNEYVELSQKAKLQLSKTLLSLKDISERGIAFTNVMTLPTNNLNDRLCGYPSRLASDNKAFETNQRYLLGDAGGIISRGDVVIKSFNRQKGIKIQLAEGYGFWALAGKRKMEDLVVDQHDFEFTDVNMDALKVKGSSVFLTALHSATGASTNTALSTYKYTRPCYRFEVLLPEIVEQLGYTLDYGNTLELTDITLLGCMSNTSYFYVSDFKRRFQDDSVVGLIDISTASSIFAKAGNVSLAGTTLTNALYKTSYVFKGYVESSVNTSLSFTFGASVESVLVPKGRSFVNFRSDEVDIGSTMTITANSLILMEDVYIYSAINEGDISEVTTDIDVDSYLVLADYNLPQQTFKRFIKNLFKISFLDLTIDEERKTVTLEYLPFKISTNNALDLSDNVIRYHTITSGDIYAQLNSLSYENDEDISPNLGTAFFNIENDSAKENSEFIKVSDYSASNEITVSGENIIVASIYDVLTQKRQSVKDRIVFFEEVGAFGFNAVFNKASMQRVYSDRYFPFVNATKRERSTKLEVYLNALQYRKLLKTPVIYIKFLEAHFLVTGIKGFDRKEPCTLEVVKYN